MSFKPGINFFGKLHHPAIGIRIPEIFLPGITSALRQYHTASGLMLSYGRETSTEKIINAPFGKYPLSLGHTGTSIRFYLREAQKWARRQKISLELEADHLIIIGSPERAVKRIEGVFEKERISSRQLEASFRYNFSALREALSTVRVGCFTTDTSDLFNLEVDSWSKREREKKFQKITDFRTRKELQARYLDRGFLLGAVDGAEYQVWFEWEEVIALYLKYQESLKANARLYDYLRRRLGKNFGFEISMDETEFLTPLKDALFYLNEWTVSGRHFDYFAPNIGFKKRSDYTGSLPALERRVKKFSALCRYFDSALLSFHSGSGTSPWSGKGKEVYPVLLRATGEKLKYKISGVYYELLLELLAGGKAGRSGLELFQEIFDRVYEFCWEQVRGGGELASPLLKKQLLKYERDLKAGRSKARDCRADFFRFHSWLALTFRDEKGRRIYRQELVELYQKNSRFRRVIDREVFALTERLIRGLKFENNY